MIGIVSQHFHGDYIKYVCAPLYGETYDITMYIGRTSLPILALGAHEPTYVRMDNSTMRFHRIADNSFLREIKYDGLRLEHVHCVFNDGSAYINAGVYASSVLRDGRLLRCNSPVGGQRAVCQDTLSGEVVAARPYSVNGVSCNVYKDTMHVGAVSIPFATQMMSAGNTIVIGDATNINIYDLRTDPRQYGEDLKSYSGWLGSQAKGDYLFAVVDILSGTFTLHDLRIAGRPYTLQKTSITSAHSWVVIF